MKNLLKLMDLSEKEIIEILNTADQLKFEKKNGIPHRLLEGKTLGLIFAKSSTRTRVSFEVGMFDLGGTSLFLSSRDLQIGRGEIVQDTARVLSRYLDGIMIRTFDQKEVEALAEFGTIPIINGLTDYCHPCQVLADLMTIREYKGDFAGRKLCYVGDGNNMTNSLIVGGIKLGMKVAVACPKGYEPDAEIMKWAYATGDFECGEDVLEMAKDSDVLYTDVWASMGQEAEAEERKKVFKQYQINDKVLGVSRPDAMVLHCLPAHREEEITSKVFEEHSKEIFDEAENRLHAQKAALVKCLR
ncbi:MAG TPA: ornithine carbamoyltransferase [Candidatus Limadaptatus stercorigallinarum]|uniref:Ornithine carbamoyltransferase n=1 Tax=Candidatus Limadaptatus stercorigallinarum TaxID=2840845 RepID=A0A9D1HRW4_9FIRM|nr:ornithine carbamoyltransferase [Candidatus Limadaptatus stercorigallinarum]